MSTQPNSTPTVQGKTKYLYVFCTFKKIMSELTCNAQDVDGAVVVCRKQKMDQKRKAKKQKRSPSHLPTCHMPYTTCSVGPISNCQLPVCVRGVCVNLNILISIGPVPHSLPLSLSLSLSPRLFLTLTHSVTRSLFLTLQNKKIKGQTEVTVLVLYRTVPSIPDLPYPPVPR